MTNKQVVAKTADFIKEKFAKDSTGHDWWHIYRVWQLSKHIAREEKDADLLIVELAALLHDIADHKFHGGSVEVGAQQASDWLQSLKVDEQVVLAVADIVRNVSFKTAKIKPKLNTIEGQIVYDADKLDAIGAIGIARTFTFGGAHGRLVYDPDQPHLKDYTYERAHMQNTSAVHHFYEKLLHLKGRMYTKTAKKMAEHRHEYIENFLKEFYREWDGEI